MKTQTSGGYPARAILLYRLAALAFLLALLVLDGSFSLGTTIQNEAAVLRGLFGPGVDALSSWLVFANQLFGGLLAGALGIISILLTSAGRSVARRNSRTVHRPRPEHNLSIGASDAGMEPGKSA